MQNICAFLCTFSRSKSKQFGNSKQGVTRVRLGAEVIVDQALQVRVANTVGTTVMGAALHQVTITQ